MFSGSYAPSEYSSDCLAVKLLDELRDAVLRVKRARKWFLVNPLTRAFVKACMIMRLTRVRSIILMKAIIKAIRELKQIISQEHRLIEVGVHKAWKLSELASSWGHKTAREWRNNKAYIMLQALILQWISRLFNSIIRI